MAQSEETAGSVREREKGYIDAAPACKLIAIVELIGRQNMHTTTAAATLTNKNGTLWFSLFLYFFLASFLHHFFVVLIKFVLSLHIFGDASLFGYF